MRSIRSVCEHNPSSGHKSFYLNASLKMDDILFFKITNRLSNEFNVNTFRGPSIFIILEKKIIILDINRINLFYARE